MADDETGSRLTLCLHAALNTGIGHSQSWSTTTPSRTHIPHTAHVAHVSHVCADSLHARHSRHVLHRSHHHSLITHRHSLLHGLHLLGIEPGEILIHLGHWIHPSHLAHRIYLVHLVHHRHHVGKMKHAGDLLVHLAHLQGHLQKIMSISGPCRFGSGRREYQDKDWG